MKNLPIIALVMGAMLLSSFTKKTGHNQLSRKEKKEGWQLLFDGKAMGQWRGYCKDTIPGAWGIADEAIFLSVSGKGEAGGRDGGDIITQRKFRNFELSLEWKIAEGGNSGIFYLGQEQCATGSTKREPIFRNAPEMQILDNERHPDAKLG